VPALNRLVPIGPSATTAMVAALLVGFRGTIVYGVSSNKAAWLDALDLISKRVARLTDPVPVHDGPDGELVWSPSGREL
ncbi:MAG: hypothetical protein ACRDPV_05380, partial [Gaiellaceae bacterium]